MLGGSIIRRDKPQLLKVEGVLETPASAPLLFLQGSAIKHPANLVNTPVTRSGRDSGAVWIPLPICSSARGARHITHALVQKPLLARTYRPGMQQCMNRSFVAELGSEMYEGLHATAGHLLHPLESPVECQGLLPGCTSLCPRLSKQPRSRYFMYMLVREPSCATSQALPVPGWTHLLLLTSYRNNCNRHRTLLPPSQISIAYTHMITQCGSVMTHRVRVRHIEYATHLHL